MSDSTDPSSPSPARGATSTAGGGRPGRTSRGRGWWRWGAVILAAATVVAAMTTLQSYYMILRYTGSADFWRVAAYSFPDWYIWALLAPFIVRLGRRFPLEGGRLGSFAAHFGFGAAFALGELFLSCVLLSVLIGVPEGHDDFVDYYLDVVGAWIIPMVLAYWVILVAGQAIDYYRKYRRSQLQASELRAQLATAQLSALRMQLHPHFLFNTLHSIGVLVRKRDTNRALKMLTGLGDLLRHALDSPRQMITLEEELCFIRRYLEVEQIRFGDRLQVEYDVSREAYGALVPNLILQPLVENAIRHGVAPHAARRTLRLEARREDSRLRLRVSDDGPGLPGGWTADESRGVGLRNVRQRLRRIYGEDQRFQVVRGRPEGAVARIEIPYAREGEDGDEPHPTTAGGDEWMGDETVPGTRDDEAESAASVGRPTGEGGAP